jgi:hypothetical protein
MRTSPVPLYPRVAPLTLMSSGLCAVSRRSSRSVAADLPRPCAEPVTEMRATGQAAMVPAVSFGILLASGVFLPPGRAPVIDLVGTVLPVRHGLVAVRAGLDGCPYVVELVAEALVGIGWALVAFAVTVVQTRRARRHGIDDFA